MNLSKLKNIGLNDSEMKVYLALLELDQTTVGSIVKKSGVQDSKIYHILSQLQEKGLVSYIIKGSYKYYQASDPQNLLRLLSDKKREIELEEDKVANELIPLIKQRRKEKKDVQEAFVYESMDGLKAAYNYLLDTMNSGEEYYVFNLGEDLAKKEFILFFTNYHAKRIEKKVRVKFIAPQEVQKLVTEKYKYDLVERKYTSKKFPIGTIIFKDHVMTLSMKDKPTAFIIKSKTNYEYYKSFFEDMWKTI